MAGRLFRSEKDRFLGGVCGGLGQYFNIDPVLVRVVFVILAFANGLGIVAYIALWLIAPKESRVAAEPGEAARINVEGVISELKELESRVKAALPGKQAAPSQERASHQSGLFWLGLIILLVGVILLLNNLVFPAWFNLVRFWPILLILAGVVLLLGRRRK